MACEWKKKAEEVSEFLKDNGKPKYGKVVDQLIKERYALSNRCCALTGGTMCLFCPIDCGQRKTPFRDDDAVNEVLSQCDEEDDEE